MKRCAVLIVLFALTVGAFATASSESEASAGPVTIRFAHNWSGADVKAPVWEGMLNAYGEEHADALDLQLEPSPGMELQQKMLVQLAGDDLPDLFMYWAGAGNLKPFVDADALVDLKSVLTKTSDVDLSKYSDAVLNNTTYNGVLYGLPVEIWYGYFVANQSIFDQYNQKIPETWDELLSVSAVFRDNGIIPISIGAQNSWPGRWFFVALVNQFADGVQMSMGGGLERDFQFAGAPTLTAARAIQQLRDSHFLPKDTAINYGPSLALYTDKQAAMTLAFSWMTQEVPADVSESSVVIPIPKLDASSNPNELPGSNGMNFYVTRAAWDDPAKQPFIAGLADLIASDEMTLALAKLGIPMAKSIELDPADMNPLYAKAATWAAGKPLYVMHFPPDHPEVGDVVKGSTDELFAGIIDADEFVQKIQDALDQAK